MTINADYTAAPAADFTELGPNEFTAGSLLSLNCIVHGNSEHLTYTWSVMATSYTTECTGCNINVSSATSILNLGSAALTSYHAGIYTCNVSESGRPDTYNSDDYTVTVVGKRMCTFFNIVCCDINHHPGAGIYAIQSQSEPRPIASNGLIVSSVYGLVLECVSSSSQSGVGMITGLDGNTLPTGNTGDIGIWRVNNPFRRPGVLRLQTIYSASFTNADQGIYTCTIPDSNDNQININVGLYPFGFMGELHMQL